MSNLKIAGVVYERGAPIGDVLSAFIQELKDEGLNVHGILQETPEDMDLPPENCGVDAIDIKHSTRVALVRPTQYELDNKICSLDLGQLAEASMILRRALDDGADIVVVEKFGRQEKDGGGLSEDLRAVMAEGIPTVVSVPQSELEGWNAFRGELGENLPCDLDQLRTWWQSHNI